MVSFTCTPGSTLVTACAVPTTSAAPAPGAMVNGTLTAASFVVAPESMKVPPAATLQQVLLVMLAIALLFLFPSTRRFRTRDGAGRSDAGVHHGGRMHWKPAEDQDNDPDGHAFLRWRHQAGDHRERLHHVATNDLEQSQAARSGLPGRAAFFFSRANSAPSHAAFDSSIFPVRKSLRTRSFLFELFRVALPLNRLSIYSKCRRAPTNYGLSRI